jgi:hypothetical protein
VQPDSASPEPVDATPAAPGGTTGTGAGAREQQPSLLGEHLEQLAVAEQLATWRAFAAPLATDSGAVVGDPELVRLAVNILAVYANHQSRSGLTYAQLRDGLRQMGSHLPQAATDARLEHLHRMGFLEPYLPKLYQGRYIVRPAGLAGALAAARVTERGGIDELILLLDRTRAALGTRHPDPVQVLTHLNSCRHALMVFALDLHRRVATGTSCRADRGLPPARPQQLHAPGGGAQRHGDHAVQQAPRPG